MTGVVIGSYGMPSLVEANIAAIRTSNSAATPVLVHDDCTPPSKDPSGLFSQARRKPFDIYRTESQLGHVAGDISCFIQGLRWAHGNGLTYLAKLSQRFIYHEPGWIAQAEREIEKEDTDTLAQMAAHGHWRPWGTEGVRTECIMMRVSAWARQPIYNFLASARITPEIAFRRAADKFTRGFTRWRKIPVDKANKRPWILWHDANQESEYIDLAKRFGVDLNSYTNAGWPEQLQQNYFTG